MNDLLVNQSLHRRLRQRCLCGRLPDGSARKVVRFTYAKLVYETLAEWEAAALEFAHIAAGVDYEGEIDAFGLHRAARERVARAAGSGLSGHSGRTGEFILEFLSDSYLTKSRGKPDAAVSLELVERMLFCQRIWEEFCKRMSEFADCGDFYRLTGAAELYEQLCRRGLGREEVWPEDPRGDLA